tara:strand:+ start:1545 stop:1844 length:300 start_codon:yes stop_codon:yes gene_type:complete
MVNCRLKRITGSVRTYEGCDCRSNPNCPNYQGIQKRKEQIDEKKKKKNVSNYFVWVLHSKENVSIHFTKIRKRSQKLLNESWKAFLAEKSLTAKRLASG